LFVVVVSGAFLLAEGLAEIQTAEVLNVVAFLATGSSANDESSSDDEEEEDDDDEEEDDEDQVLPGDDGAVSSMETSVISIGLSRDMLDRKLESEI